MLRYTLLFSCFLLTVCVFAQNKPVYNLDFELVKEPLHRPMGWGQGGISDTTINKEISDHFRLDSLEKQSGRYSLLIDWNDAPTKWTATVYKINKVFQGKKIKLTGYVKTEKLEEWCGLWLRLDDADNKSVEFNNMQNKPIKGTTNWKEYSITLDYEQAKVRTIVFGGLIVGSGKMWLDNLHVSIDGKDIFELESMLAITLDTLSVKAAPGLPPVQPATTRAWEIMNTSVALNFDWMGKTADVKEWIKLRPYFYPVDSIVLDAKSMQLDSVELLGKKGNTPLKYTYANDQLVVRFGNEYKMTDTIGLYLKYKAMPYQNHTTGSGAINDEKGLYFINTDHKMPNKPAQIWTQGETESNSHWMITVDKPNTRFTTQIELNIPDSLTTLSNGALVKQIKGTKGMRTDIWRMDLPIQAYAVMFAIGKFSVVKEQWRNKEVSYYVEPAYAPYAKQMFNHTPEMIEYFSQVTGVPYPWNKYSQVVVSDYVSGAMENTSATLCGEFINGNTREIADHNSEDIVAHELFHQWFGDYVTCESWSNLTVNESFANYGEQLWRTYKYGKNYNEELAFNDLSGYLGASTYNDPQLVRFNYDNRENMFDAISYNKGGSVLRYLHSLMGDAAFSRSMNLYLTKNALHSAEAHNWRLACEEATGMDWNWFFNQWYYMAGHPVLKVTNDYNDSLKQLTIVVSQTQKDSLFQYRLPIKCALIYGNEKTIIDWVISKKTDTFNYAYKNGKKPVVVVDIERVVPAEIKDNKKMEQWLEIYKMSQNYISKHLAISAAGKLVSDSCSQLMFELSVKDTLSSIRKQSVSLLSKISSDKNRRTWIPVFMDMATKDINLAVRTQAVEVLGSWKVAKAKDLFLKGIYDSSYNLAANALDGLSKLDADTAYILSKQLLKTNPKSNLYSTVWSRIGKKAEDGDIALFEQEAPFVYGNKKYGFGTAIFSYVKSVKSEESFARGIELMKIMITTESNRNQRSSVFGNLAQVLSEQADNAKSEKPEESVPAKKRIELVKTACQVAIDAESDSEKKKDFEKLLKEALE